MIAWHSLVTPPRIVAPPLPLPTELMLTPTKLMTLNKVNDWTFDVKWGRRGGLKSPFSRTICARVRIYLSINLYILISEVQYFHHVKRGRTEATVEFLSLVGTSVRVCFRVSKFPCNISFVIRVSTPQNTWTNVVTINEIYFDTHNLKKVFIGENFSLTQFDYTLD